MRNRTTTRFVLSALTAALAAAGMGAQAPAPESNPEGFDLAAVENGGRAEWASGQQRLAGQLAINLLARTKHPGWLGRQKTEEEIVFSFFSRQRALVSSVHLNPATRNYTDRPKDVEVWISNESPTDGFTRVAAATLENEDRLQAIAFDPVEATFVKLRLLTTNSPLPNHKPGDFPIAASRVRIIEGERPGYVSMLARHPELAALAKGIVPQPPPPAPLPADAAGVSPCAAPTTTPLPKSRFAQSRQVLVITDDPNGYRAVQWKPLFFDQVDSTRLAVPGVGYTWITPGAAAPAHLIAHGVDTVVFAQVCTIDQDLSPAFKQALLAWVAAGHKVIFQDSDYCAGPRSPKYPFMPYPFATVNPGAAGAAGEAAVLENSTLVSADRKSPAFIDTATWAGGPNDIGDSNVMVEYDRRWCGAMWAKNKLKKNGMALAYAHYGRGLIIYDGFDYDQMTNKIYQRLVARELLQPFDPDNLPCSQPLAGFILATKPEQKSQHMAANHTYTYPVSVRGNYGYSGVVTLDASVVPADPAVTVKLDRTTADLREADESSVSLTVTAGPAASLTSKAVAIKGRDAAGATNVLCLELPERRTGSITVTSGLRTDKPATKNLEIILDASGSMKALLGKRTRWATAQAVLKDVVTKLPKDFAVGLRVYGHTLPSTNPGTCTDSALVVPVGPLNPDALLAAAGKLAPRGETPLVYSILRTPGDLKPVGGGTVILITDGEESCKGDFAAAAKALADAGMNLTLNIVGFTLKNAPAQAQLTTLAESTGGHYYGAPDGQALARAVLLAAVDKLPYRILDAAGKEVASGEAGKDDPHELPPGAYTVVMTAADREVRTPVKLALAQDVTMRAVVRADMLVLESK
jgi:hypothetical protein